MSITDRGPAATAPDQLATMGDVAKALAGFTGAKGPTGDKGAMGDKGPTGDKGPAGDAGTGGGGGYTDVPVVMSDGQSFTVRKFTGSNLCVWFGQLTNNTGASIAAGTTLGTIPEGVRPRFGMQFALVNTAGSAITSRIAPNFGFNFVGSWSAGSTIHMGGVSYIAES